ncbi:chemotaxis protein [Maridesulfovibrio salexigens]|uniref:Response regulator receiver modulated CheW protein n=1 Tax=Maridesulfovibrio salexigens (strain ATCC 14822 / DSM 2638 / NCIMB 8403 / VKM B-1763) TaxID=526222 RepID=C6BU49_MARSD|nr:chemotaxis protein [Maridesulfovibrio salexigens]ACS81758.1 response regulator receiver modulated CheW protein [Maridesulfovibrio salexigens DSM 2638]
MSQTNILLESGTNELEIVEFYIDEVDNVHDGSTRRSFYGINVAKVVEIIRLPELTDMPDAANDAVLGAFDLRSEIIPLIDLSRRVGKNRIEDEAPKVIVTEFNKISTAFLVSGVTRIHRISWEQVEAPSKQVSSLTANSITGVVKLEGRIVFLLDLEKIVADLNPDMDLTDMPEASLVDKIEKRQLKALISDDSTMIRRMIGQMLEDAGFRVTRTHNGKAAWDKIVEWKATAESEGKSINDYLDIVVTDIEMPVMDGHNLTKRIKDDHELRNIPVLLCSSIITDTLYHKGESVGADDQISKAEINQLAERVFKLIERYENS